LPMRLAAFEGRMHAVEGRWAVERVRLWGAEFGHHHGEVRFTTSVLVGAMDKSLIDTGFYARAVFAPTPHEKKFEQAEQSYKALMKAFEAWAASLRSGWWRRRWQRLKRLQRRTRRR
jgi:hypothetical protein